MSTTAQALLINAVVLVAVLEADLGRHRKVGAVRVLRPLVVSATIGGGACAGGEMRWSQGSTGSPAFAVLCQGAPSMHSQTSSEPESPPKSWPTIS